LSGKHALKRGARTYLPVVAAIVVVGILVGSALLAMRFERRGGHTDATASRDATASHAAADDSSASASPSGSTTADALAGDPALPVTPSTQPTPAETRPAERADRGAARTTPSATRSPAAAKTSAAGTGGGAVTSSGTCGASFYDTGSTTANGEAFDPEGLTAASKTLAFNTRVRVTNTANGKQVVVRINDRGPFVAGRCLDLARGAFRQIASLGAGVLTARFEILA
jgi:rare lipoprotein A